MPALALTLDLDPKEAGALERLLGDHLYFGWVELEGEFDLAASGVVSEALRSVYRRLREARRQRPDSNG
ncbi:MAG: hypothetical protein KatS3mg070_2285 [Meiothermus sp.]|uniref:peptidylprolyl isomerase n=1 Tax=Meiothermus sp. TaxID=1955249 RepID=UPI0021DDF0AC|nr:peptidylprolyl isomerase [Meiothermus sp.]GIW28922.1 MAG: hypothetical protein KatS3mg070_2285 [Meiothermus sp.]